MFRQLVYKPRLFDGVVVHLRTCRTQQEQSLLANIAESMFSNFLFDTDYRRDIEGNINLMFGSSKKRNNDWHKARRRVLHTGRALVVEDPVLRRGSVAIDFNSQYFRLGINGFLPKNCRRFANLIPHHLVDMNKFNFKLNPLKEMDLHKALIVGQVPGDASLDGLDILTWVADSYVKLKNHFKFVKVRTPQIESKSYTYAFENNEILQNLEFGTYENKESSISESSAVISFSSTFACESFLTGVPTFADSPNSFVYDFVRRSSDIYMPLDFSDRRLEFLSLVGRFEFDTEELAALGKSIDFVEKLESVFAEG